MGKIDLSETGSRLERFFKWLRGTWLLNWRWGWKRLGYQGTVSGTIHRLEISGDGDVTWWMDSPVFLTAPGNSDMLHCEVPLSYRERVGLDELRKLQDGVTVTVSGRWVLDRGHGWCEIHPVDSLRVW